MMRKQSDFESQSQKRELQARKERNDMVGQVALLKQEVEMLKIQLKENTSREET